MEEVKIYTRAGDTGTTGLFQGPRVSKSSLRIQAYGTVDELNSTVAIAKNFCHHQDVKKLLERLQYKLMNITSILAAELSNTPKESLPAIEEADITGLERCIDYFNRELPPINQFIISGQNQAGATLDAARTVCRRAERQVVLLTENEPVAPIIQKFINRLSDLLFVLERFEHHQAGLGDTFWKK